MLSAMVLGPVELSSVVGSVGVLCVCIIATVVLAFVVGPSVVISVFTSSVWLASVVIGSTVVSSVSTVPRSVVTGEVVPFCINNTASLTIPVQLWRSLLRTAPARHAQW